MNAIDVLLVLVILFSIWMGWRRGAIAGFADLISWIGSLLVALSFYKNAGSFLVNQIALQGVWVKPLAFIFLLLLSRFTLTILLSFLLPSAHADVNTKPLNRIFGMIPGLVNGVVSAVIIAALLLLLPLSSGISSNAKNSQAVTLLAGELKWFDDNLAPIFDPAIKKAMQNRTVYPDAETTTQLNFSVPNALPKPSLEMEMLYLINKERIQQGLSALRLEASLLPAARLHSKDMLARGYFSHYSPEGNTVADRLKSINIRFIVAGENLALAQSVLIAHEGLMNSPGHRANILHKSYGQIAIGILDGGRHGLMITQVFKN